MSDQDLTVLRERLEDLDQVDLEDRAELFEECHGALVAELERLEEAAG